MEKVGCKPSIESERQESLTRPNFLLPLKEVYWEVFPAGAFTRSGAIYGWIKAQIGQGLVIALRHQLNSIGSLSLCRKSFDEKVIGDEDGTVLGLEQLSNDSGGGGWEEEEEKEEEERSPDMFSFGFQRSIGPGASHVACKGQAQVRMMFTVLMPGVSLLVALSGGRWMKKKTIVLSEINRLGHCL